MTTTDEAAAGPVLGEIIVAKVRDGSHCVLWTLGTTATLRGLTVAGRAAALAASGAFLASLGDDEQRALHKPGDVHVTQASWSVPLLPGRSAEIAAMMTEVINAPGAIGWVS